MQPSHGNGHFVWYDLMSTDPPRIDAFYSALFGWTVDPEPVSENGYRLLRISCEPFGGVLPWGREMGPPSHWMGYIQVEALDITAARATELGAPTVLGPMDIPNVARFSIVSDPTGGSFVVYDPRPAMRSNPPGYDGPEGSVIWNELITNDLRAAVDFYSDLFGWETDPATVAAGGYVVARQNGTPVAGIFRPPADPANSAWVSYFKTIDIEKSLATVTNEDGKIIHGIAEVPRIARTAWAADPAGAMFGIMQPEAGWLERL
jgi:uncharacterized protein